MAPPPLQAGLSGSMSSQPTLPDVVEHSGRIDSFAAVGLVVIPYGAPEPKLTCLFEPSHSVSAVGKVTGRNPHAWSAAQRPTIEPAIAVA